MARLDAVLEALSLERRAAGARFFEDLYLRFQRRVASETLTRPAGNPGAFDAEAFFAEWDDEERGLVGEERALAFAWLAKTCGFEVTTSEGTCQRPWEDDAPLPDEPRRGQGLGGSSLKVRKARAHRGVIATIDGRRILADAGFPLPALVPLSPAAREIPTGMGTLSATVSGDGGVRIRCEARGVETELLRLDVAPNPSPLPLEETSGTSHDASPQPEPRGAFALRILDDRVLFWRAGRMTILDAWSRLEYPLPASERAAIEKIFALDLEGISLPEKPPAEAPEPATLSVSHLSPVAPEEARGRVGKGALPLLLVSSREERVVAAPGGSLITIRATLSDVPPLGPGEAVRKTLVFHLVSELFELGREDGSAEGRPG
ncbi:MAG: arylamine N-acetyltransferase [Thermoanaerobaculia bacterium]|nr:arylamine N-acetyltransferase [Thermoanaerobaculia bacterium]